MTSTAPPPALACHRLSRVYRSGIRRTAFTAVDAVSLEVPAGSAFALVGPNGAGKTTLMLMAIGLMRPTDGTATIDGRDARTSEARRGIGFVPEKFQLPRQLTGREFLRLHAALAGVDGARVTTRIDEVAVQVDLADRMDEKVGGFSKGMQQRIAIAQALLAEPRLLVLDEPTSALDPLQRRALRDTLRRVHADGCTIVLNSHNLAEVEDICDHVAILEDGRIVSSGALRDMVERTTRVRVRVRGWTDALAATLGERVTLDALHHSDGDTTFTASVPDDDAVAWIAHTVVGAGAWLFELSPSGEGLEDLFVRTIAGSGATGSAAPAPAPADAPEARP
ncbi:MAG: transporter related protein [Thermoleophilia bacterium]|nr:transporter related protein [Thermoleophilia bacterium]